MYKDKKFLAIIPARSGSKGLKDKNIKLLADKPLIAYTIEQAINSQIFDNIIVSTDSEKYADIAKKYGANVPFLRPMEIARDISTTREVVLHAIQYLEGMNQSYDYIMILQPTSPLRTQEDIIQCIELLMDKGAKAIISMSECEHPVEWTTYLGSEKCLKGLSAQFKGRRQDNTKSYRLNGAIYLIECKYYKENEDIYGEHSYAYIMKKENAIDIDDIYDFIYAEVLIKSQQ